MIEKALDIAVKLGFGIERTHTTKQWYKLTFPSDCAYPPAYTYTAKDVLRTIKRYEEREESAKEDAEHSRQTEQTINALRQKLSKPQ